MKLSSIHPMAGWENVNHWWDFSIFECQFTWQFTGKGSFAQKISPHKLHLCWLDEIPTSWPVGQLFKQRLPFFQAWGSACSVGLLKPTAHVSAVVILIPNMWYLMSPLSHLRESLPLRRGLQTMFRNRWEWIALSDSQGWLTPEQKMLRNSSGRCTSKLLQTLWSGIFWYDFCTMVESDLLPALLKSCL